MHKNPRALIFLGALIIVVVGFLAAFVPGIAYVTVQSHFLDTPDNPYGLPSVYYPSLDFSTHIFSLKFLICMMGGLLGLIHLLKKNLQLNIGVFAIALTSIGLILPKVNDTRITFPEMRLFDVPWIGSLLILVGLCLMFIGLMLEKNAGPKFSFSSIPLLLIIYSISPILVVTNNFPWILFGAPNSPISLFILFLVILGHLIMIWGILWSHRIARRRNC